MPAPFVSASQLRRRLDELLSEHPTSSVVFDADGTLWRHDVGCLVFEAAYEAEVLRDEARDGLLDEARAAGLALPSDWPVNRVARALEEAFLRGQLDECRAAALQVWAYAGHTPAAVRAYAEQVLRTDAHRRGLHTEVLGLADWARSRGARTLVVSASPRIIVEVAVEGLGFEPGDIAAGDPRQAEGALAPGLELPLPYGPEKVVSARALLEGAFWLATFGDSGFDVDMMHGAHLAVGIGDKPQMLAGLARHPRGLRLRLDEP
jgi:phosphoserine phosphatase